MVKLSLFLTALAGIAGSSLALPVGNESVIEKRAPDGTQGFDVSHYQGTVNMQAQYNNGARFVIIKATEGTSYKDPSFSANYNGATNAGLIRGGYHFARPDSSSGASQANFFLANGGGWSNDGRTLPGMLDIEYNPSGATCYGLSASAMVNWISDFTSTYHSKTGRYPIIYTTNDWWNQCTGNSKAFSSTSPLNVARYGSSSVGTIPGGWATWTFWQWSDKQSPYPGDEDTFNGPLSGLKKLATG